MGVGLEIAKRPPVPIEELLILPLVGPGSLKYYQEGMKLQKVKTRKIPRALSPSDIVAGNSPQSIPEILSRPGRPKKGETWRDCIKKVMDQENVEGVTVREEIALRVQGLARAGVPWAIQWLADREEGRPAQSVTVEAGSARNPMLDLDDEELARLVNLAKSPKLLE